MIETDRLLLEPLRFAHAERMFDGLSDEALYQYLPELPPPSKKALQERYRALETTMSPDGNEAWLNWILVCRVTRKVVGYTQVTVRKDEPSLIAYLIFKPQWRTGFASEAVTATIEHVFSNYDTAAIDAYVDTKNEASKKLVIKLGFNHADTIEQADYFKGASSDEFRYSMAREKWMR